mmetsp:Transcript_104674/g.305589  ORF Transcript_104674/g.305589 Transcript_104674/m.305589 type:complete len:202 (+) Transcript_104674:1-606(+)
MDLRGDDATVDAQAARAHARQDEEPAAAPVRDHGHLVADEAEHRVHQDAQAVDQLCTAHEHGLPPAHELVAFHSKQIRHPSGTQEARVEAVGRQRHDARHRPLVERGRPCPGAARAGGGLGRRGRLLGRRLLLALPLPVAVGHHHAGHEQDQQGEAYQDRHEQHVQVDVLREAADGGAPLVGQPRGHIPLEDELLGKPVAI